MGTGRGWLRLRLWSRMGHRLRDRDVARFWRTDGAVCLPRGRCCLYRPFPTNSLITLIHINRHSKFRISMGIRPWAGPPRSQYRSDMQLHPFRTPLRCKLMAMTALGRVQYRHRRLSRHLCRPRAARERTLAPGCRFCSETTSRGSMTRGLMGAFRVGCCRFCILVICMWSLHFLYFQDTELGANEWDCI